MKQYLTMYYRQPTLTERRILLLFMMVLVMLNVSACSNRQLYDGAMHNRRHACLKLLPQQQAECLERYQKPYDQYEQERQAQLTKDGSL